MHNLHFITHIKVSRTAGRKAGSINGRMKERTIGNGQGYAKQKKLNTNENKS